MISIGHGIYDYEFDMIYYRQHHHYLIPNKFRRLLRERAFKWEEKGWTGDWKYTLIPFTYGLDVKNNIWAIAIKHPLDKFRKDIGEDIVKGRLARQRGEMAPQRWEYNRIVKEEPNFMICHNIDVGDLTIAQCEMNNVRE